MNLYDWIFFATIPLYLLSVHYLFLAQGGKPRNKRGFYVTFILWGIIIMLVRLHMNIPAVNVICSTVILILLSKYYFSSQFQCFSSILLTICYITAVEVTLSVFLEIPVLPMEFTSFDSNMVIIFLRTFLLTSSYFLYRFRSRSKVHFPLSSGYYLGYTCIIGGVLFLFLGFITNSSMSEGGLLLSCVILLLVVFLIFHMDEKLQTSFRYHSENVILKEQAIAFQNQQEIINQSLYNRKALKHDMKNQIFTLQALVEQGKAEDIRLQTEKMLADIEGEKSLANSGHFVVDSLINHKLGACQSVELVINLQVSEELPMLAYDLTIILGNLLDNAVTATENSKTKPYIHISLDHDRGNLMFEISNSYNGKVHYDDGVYHSTKPFAVNHGYGLENVKQVVKKYDGILKIEHGSDFFVVKAMIPLVK